MGGVRWGLRRDDVAFLFTVLANPEQLDFKYEAFASQRMIGINRDGFFSELRDYDRHFLAVLHAKLKLLPYLGVHVVRQLVALKLHHHVFAMLPVRFLGYQLLSLRVAWLHPHYGLFEARDYALLPQW